MSAIEVEAEWRPSTPTHRSCWNGAWRYTGTQGARRGGNRRCDNKPNQTVTLHEALGRRSVSVVALRECTVEANKTLGQINLKSVDSAQICVGCFGALRHADRASCAASLASVAVVQTACRPQLALLAFVSRLGSLHAFQRDAVVGLDTPAQFVAARLLTLPDRKAQGAGQSIGASYVRGQQDVEIAGRPVGQFGENKSVAQVVNEKSAPPIDFIIVLGDRQDLKNPDRKIIRDFHERVKGGMLVTAR